MAAVRADFFLDSTTRLTEQERALMTAMLADLVAMLADEFKVLLADAEPANDDSDQLFDRLWRSGLLDIAGLVALLLRRAEEERLAAGMRSSGAGGRPRFLQALVSDEDSDVSAAAMALILARGRRRDRFDGPRIAFADLSAEVAVAMVNGIAAALRIDLARRLGSAEADERLAGAVQALLATHDEGNRLEARVFDLVHALDRGQRVDESLIRAAMDDGEVALVVEALARRSGIGFDSAWDHFTGGRGDIALLLRLGAVSRELAGEFLAGAADVLGAEAETEIRCFDELADDDIEQARKWLRLDPAYRTAITSLGSGNGQRTV